MRNICIICAIPQETRQLLARFTQRSYSFLSGFKSWTIASADRSITILESGIGQHNAARAATTAIELIRPDCIISSGFCGAVTAGLHVGDIVTADVIRQMQQGVPAQIITLDTDLNKFLLARYTTAEFISSDTIYSKSEILKSLPTSATTVVEMESYAVASICEEHRVQFVAVRAVSDALGTDPSQLFRLIADQNFNIRMSAVILALIRKPSLLGQIFSLAKGAQIAGKSLATAVVNIVEKL